MSRELDGYRMTVHKLSRKHDDYAQLMEMFNQKLSKLSRHVEKAQLKVSFLWNRSVAFSVPQLGPAGTASCPFLSLLPFLFPFRVNLCLPLAKEELVPVVDGIFPPNGL